MFNARRAFDPFALLKTILFIIVLAATGACSAAHYPDSEAIGTTTQELDLVPNYALGKPATQSSTGWGGAASRAVDGNTDGNFFDNSVTHTLLEANAWWEVDLGPGP